MEVIKLFGPRELDIKNTYNPNLQDIRESSLRTYGEANSFYRKEELYMKDVERRILSKELSKEEDIYDVLKDKEPFTIEGYKVTISTKKIILDEQQEDKKEEEITNYIYLLDKKVLDDAVDQTVKTFISEEDYENYKLDKQKRQL